MDDKQAVSPIISMVLLIGIVLVVTTVILSWATPILQRSQSEAHYGSALGYFNALDSALEDVRWGEGASRTVDVSIGAGNIYISESMNETWIVSYGLNDSMRIRFSDLGYPQDDTFEINSTKPENVNITIYWPEGDDLGEPNYPPESGGLINPTSTTVHANAPLTGTVYIRVNKLDNTETLAELWLFDIMPISYELPSAFGTYYIKEINGGIITQATGERYVTDAPLITETGNSILMDMIQTGIKEDSLSGGGAGSYSFALNMKNMNIRTNEDVYNLTLQIYDKQGDKWDKAWYSYFESNSKFVDKGDHLLYSNNKIKLKLVQCNIDVNMESK